MLFCDQIFAQHSSLGFKWCREPTETIMNSWRVTMVVACALFPGSVAWSQPADGKLPHPCDILTDEDAQYVFGNGARLFRNGASCKIQPEDNKFLTQGVVEAWLSGVSDQRWALAKGSSMMFKQMGAKQVSGLGDDAYIWSLTAFIKKGGAQTLMIKKGGVQATVSGLYADFAKREEVIRYIGERLIAGM
jgi:hypothetical protein